jgi:mRNA interferase MazF
MNLKPGIISLVKFPQSDLEDGKHRPIVLLAPLPGPFGDWLACAVTSQLRHKVDDWDEIIDADDPDFLISGLKCSSLIRLGKLATLESKVLFLEKYLLNVLIDCCRDSVNIFKINDHEGTEKGTVVLAH